jgi:hypothetical protein
VITCVVIAWCVGIAWLCLCWCSAVCCIFNKHHCLSVGLVSVCERERDSQSEREKERERDSQSESEKEKERESESEGE